MILVRSVATWAWGLFVAIAMLAGAAGMGVGFIATIRQLMGVG